MKGRLNLFQRAMLRWRELHPYNAVHVLRIDAPLDAPQLEAAIAASLEAWSLTGLVLDAARHRYEYRGGPARVALRVVPGGAAPLDVVAAEIERELNTPFAANGPQQPFRFFAVEGTGRFHLGLAYDHYVAGGDSIAMLLSRIALRLAGAGAPPVPPPELYPATYRRLFARHPGAAVAGLRATSAIRASCRRSVRPRFPHGDGTANGFALVRLAPEEFAALARAAKTWGVTLNDAMLALALRAVAPFAGERNPADRRHELGAASILSVRADYQPGPAAAFGVFLSSFRVAHPLPAGTTLPDLARDVHAQSQRVKRDRLYLQNLLAMGGSAIVWRFLDRRQRLGLVAKTYPVWVGVSMLNVNALWPEAGGRPPVPEYIRGVPTGPLAPLVIAVTTAADVLYAGLSYRTVAFTREEIDKMAAFLVQDVRGLLP
jgi:uncharacterized protein (DUF1778 family)